MTIVSNPLPGRRSVRDRLGPRARWMPAFRVSGDSLEPSIHAGEVVLTLPRPRNVRRGRVVVLLGAGHGFLVKRVIGVAGDRVEMEAGRVHVNGVGRWGRVRIPGEAVMRWTVPPGHYFVTGDNTVASDDSRTWADPFIAHERVVGLVFNRRRRPHI